MMRNLSKKSRSKNDSLKMATPVLPEDPVPAPSVGAAPRDVACVALLQTMDPEASEGAQDILDRLAREAQLSPRDRALAFEILQGVLRQRFLLDAVWRRLESFKIAEAQVVMQEILHVGAYQYFFLDRVPVRAVVYETVELARRQIDARAVGYVNAAMRRLIAQFPKRGQALECLVAGERAETRFSFPGWLARLIKRVTGSTSFEAALEALNTPLPLYARVNTALASVEAVIEELNRMEIHARPRPDLAGPCCIEIDGPAGQAVETSAFQKGAFLIQDASAQLAAQLVGAQPGMTVVDYCAAPGGKTSALAAALQGKGTLIACDVAEVRLKRLHENLARQGLNDFVQVRLLDPEGAESAVFRAELNGGEGADRVLVDAPCSGLGTLRRHPEIRWRLNKAAIARLAGFQLAILERASRLVRPGGWLIYSTCSLAAEENERVVEAFLDRHAGAYEVIQTTDAEPLAEPLPECLTARLNPAGWLRLLPPHEPMDCASAVRIRRKG
jgi:16S rRNA (cytosine967-C5)-methyltransferase